MRVDKPRCNSCGVTAGEDARGGSRDKNQIRGAARFAGHLPSKPSNCACAAAASGWLERACASHGSNGATASDLMSDWISASVSSVCAPWACSSCSMRCWRYGSVHSLVMKCG